MEYLVDAFSAEAELKSFERCTRDRRLVRARHAFYEPVGHPSPHHLTRAFARFTEEYNRAQRAYHALCDRALTLTTIRKRGKARTTELRAKKQLDGRIINAYRTLLRSFV